MVTITVFTPTFNRRERLKRLKKSLDEQTDQKFVWMIVDDGSQDNTSTDVREYINTANYEIQYFYQENSGKHVAHNYAVEHCETDLFYCVDSDDQLPPSTIADIKEIWTMTKDKNNISGIIGLKAYFDYKVIGSEYPKNISRASLGELYNKYGKTGDTALIWRTEVIRKYPFKVFEKERFLRENTAYDLIDKEYNLLVTNKILYLVEYCEDGLTRNATQLELENPLGAAYYRLLEAKKATTAYVKFGYYTGYTFYCVRGHRKEEAKKELGRAKYSFFRIMSFLVVIRYRMRGIKINECNVIN